MSKNLTLNLLSAAAITVLAASAPQAVHAGEQQGVQCPSGFEAHLSNGNKKLTCSRERVFHLASICSPVAFTSQGKVAQLNTNITMDPTDKDQCLATVTGAKVYSVMAPPQPGYPDASMFTRKTNPSGPDVFEAKVVEFAFPTGSTFPYVGNAVNGVSCPSGYDGDSRFNGRGIRCDKLDGAPKNADCDFPWSILRDDQGNRDTCILNNQRGETKPQGMTHIQLDVERKVYEYPKAN
jgi:hypothetical protein